MLNKESNVSKLMF